MKKVILLTIFFSSIFINDSVFSGEVPKSFTEKTGYDLYKEQVQNYCTDYKRTNLKNELIFVLDEAKYFKDLEKNKPEVGKDLEKARQEYEKNMDSIYGCATYSSYYRSLKTIKEDLIKKNPKLSARLKAKLDHKMKEIEKKIKKLDGKCKINSNKNTNTNTKTNNTKNTKSSGGKSEYSSDSGAYNLVWRKPKWSFAWGNCTWYVAQYKNVTWGGNANQWMRNAKAKGYATGSSPKIGSIVQFSGRGYNPIYGHVGIVINVTGSH
ncbi:hypothetical protein DLH72_03605, partial [Candidatus Gracilibacteria bacterium]